MASWELELIAGIYAAESPSEAFKTVQGSGITIHLLASPEARSYWSYLHAHYTRPHNFGHVPSLQALRESFPLIALPRPSENLQDLCLRVQQGHVRRKTNALIEEYVAAEVEDPIKASVELNAKLTQLNALQATQRDVSFRERAWTEILEDLNALANNDGLTGMPYPWQVMNKATGGIQPGDVIMFWGIPKSKKSWLGLYVSAFLYALGYRVLVYSKEMMWPSIRRRLACIIGRVSYSRYKENALTSDELYRFLEANRRLTEEPEDGFRGELFFTDCDRPDGSIGGPTEVRQKIDLYQPDFVFLDSSYLLQVADVKDQIDWKAVGALTRQLKQVAKSTEVPMLCVFQENERSAIKYKGTRGTASVAMFSGIVMDCDVGIKLVANDAVDEVSLHFAACRETRFPGFTIKTNLAESFDFAHLNLHETPDGSEDNDSAPPPEEAEVPRDEGTSPFASRYAGLTAPVTDEVADGISE